MQSLGKGIWRKGAVKAGSYYEVLISDNGNTKLMGFHYHRNLLGGFVIFVFGVLLFLLLCFLEVIVKDCNSTDSKIDEAWPPASIWGDNFDF